MFSDRLPELWYTATYAGLLAWCNLAIAYLWLRSELTSSVQGRLEACTDRWICRLLTCGYCFGTWTFAAMWIVGLIAQEIPLSLTGLVGFGSGLGVFYYLWSSIRRNWLPV